MVVQLFHKNKDSTFTIGSTDEKSAIVSDVTISGAEKEPIEIVAQDGTTYGFAGLAGLATVEFDFIQGQTYNITEMVYGPETTSGSPILHTLNWNGSGSAKTITIQNVRAADSQTYTITMTEVEGISAPITFTKGETIVRTFTGSVAAQNITETILDAV